MSKRPKEKEKKMVLKNSVPVKSSIRPSSPGEARISPNRENDTTNLWSEINKNGFQSYKDQFTPIFFCSQKFVDNAQQYFAFTPLANFPANNLNFHWRWRWLDQIKATF